MPDETPFRIALTAIIVVTMAIGIYHRWQAARSGERISHQAEGYLFAIVLRLAGLALWAAMLAYLIAPSSVRWAMLPIPPGARWCGVALGACCPLLMYWTLSNLGRNLTDTVITRAGATLVTTGPYRYVRHPFYFTAGVLMLAVTIASANSLIGLCGALVLGLLAVRTPKEEQRLVERFGDAYRQYMVRTGRFLPRLKR